MAVLIHASLSRGTWEKYTTGWRAFESFELYTKKRYGWPLQDNTVRAFAVYLLRVRKLKPSTVRTYISAIFCLQRLKGYQVKKEREDNLLSAIIRGASNLSRMEPESKPNTRRVMTAPLLKHLGHRLAGSGWGDVAVQSIWTASLLAFFGTMRMGEILAPADDWLDPHSTMTWSDVQFREAPNGILLRIKSPKMGTAEGEFVDIFPVSKIHGCCPVAALRRQHRIQMSIGKGGPQDPLFTYPSGRYVTLDAFNKALKVLLEDIVDYSKDKISCHSFRAGLPSLISRHPDLFSSEDIKGWGRWSSEAYNHYTRLKIDQRMKIFDKIMSVFS